MINDDLVPIPTIIDQAKAMGVGLGIGDPKVHLAYLTKLRLLPQTIRRKIKGEVVGCYPIETVRKLKQIEDLKAAGWSYGEIRRELERPATPNQFSGGLVFLVIGLFIGYLAALVKPPVRTETPAPAPTTTETTSLPVQKLTSLSQDEPIYVIALPGENFGKLGKTLINLSN